jgi:hypothetical protein
MFSKFTFVRIVEVERIRRPATNRVKLSNDATGCALGINAGAQKLACNVANYQLIGVYVNWEMAHHVCEGFGLSENLGFALAVLKGFGKQPGAVDADLARTGGKSLTQSLCARAPYLGFSLDWDLSRLWLSERKTSLLTIAPVDFDGLRQRPRGFHYDGDFPFGLDFLARKGG